MGKGSKERIIKISLELYQAIRQEYKGKKYLFETRNGNPMNDRNFDKEIRRLGKKVLQRPVSAHMLRHTFCTMMIEKTGKIQAVSTYVGHASVSTTLSLYCHQSLSDEELGIL
jgi:integrase